MNKKYVAFSGIALSLFVMAGVGYLKSGHDPSYGPAAIEAEASLLKFRTGEGVMGLDIDGNGSIDDDEPKSSSTVSDGGVSMTITEDGMFTTVVWSKNEKVNDGTTKSVRTILMEKLTQPRWMRIRELYDGRKVRECSADNASWSECETHGI